MVNETAPIHHSRNETRPNRRLLQRLTQRGFHYLIDAKPRSKCKLSRFVCKDICVATLFNVFKDVVFIIWFAVLVYLKPLVRRNAGGKVISKVPPVSKRFADLKFAHNYNYL
jgi:hypothetical protein